MTKKNEVVLTNGEGAMTVDGMERIYQALTGKPFTPAERITAQVKIDAHAAKANKPPSASSIHVKPSGEASNGS